MTVFILGAGLMQIPALRAAKELGWTVVAADGNSEAVGINLADRFLHVDLKDREGLAAAAKGIRDEFGLDGVFTAGTDFSASVAWVAQELGLPGINFRTAIKASDKLEMRSALAAAGVPSPRFAAARSPKDPAIVEAGLDFPLVVKPSDSMGARGCRMVSSEAELSAAVEAAIGFSRTGRAIVEEYLDGPEFSIDALVEADRIEIRGAADRHIFFKPYFVELGHTMPSSYPKETLDEVLRVFRLGVRALGIDRGAAKGDIKFCPSRGSAFVGEIAARLSGGYMSGWTYPYASGVDLTKEALLLAVGGKLGGAPVDRGWVSAERAFISIPGTIASIGGYAEAEREPYVKDLFLRVKAGDKAVFPTNNVEKCGNVISQAPDRDAAAKAAESAARAIVLRLSPNDPDTEAFLSGDGSWPPSAFVLEGEAAQELAAMPDYDEADAGAANGSDQSSAPFLRPFARAAEVGGLDWGGRGFADSARLALSLSRDVPVVASRRLAGRFWRALARGGFQAALYVLDCEAIRGAARVAPGGAGRE